MRNYLITYRADNSIPREIRADKMRYDGGVILFIVESSPENPSRAVAVVNCDSIKEVVEVVEQ